MDAAGRPSVLSTAWTEGAPPPSSRPRPRRLFRRGESDREEPRRFLDWMIDGEPLRNRLAFPNGRIPDDVSHLVEGTQGDRYTIANLRALLGENEPGSEPWVSYNDGRVGLLVCRTCLMLDCGAVSAEVVLGDDSVEWRDVCFQDGATEEIAAYEVAPFSVRFDRVQYERLIRDLLVEWQGSA